MKTTSMRFTIFVCITQQQGRISYNTYGKDEVTGTGLSKKLQTKQYPLCDTRLPLGREWDAPGEILRGCWKSFILIDRHTIGA